MRNKALICSFLSLGLIPILPTRILGLPVVLFALTSLFSIFYYKNKKLAWRKLLILIFPYLMFCLSVLYSENMAFGFKKVMETRLSLFLIPILFCFLNNHQLNLLSKKQCLLKKIFMASSFSFCCIYFLSLFFIKESENPAFRYPSGFFFKSALQEIPFIEYEPVYISFILVISIIFLVELFLRKKIKVYIAFIFIVFYFSVIFLMVNKLVIIFLILFFTSLLFRQIKVIKYRIIILFSFVLVGLSISKIPSIDYEIKELQSFIKGEKLAKDDATDIRKKIIISSLELMYNINPIVGVGIGDIQKELNNIYYQKNYKNLLEKKYDTHNQYFSMFISTGIVGLLSLFFVFFMCLKLCLKNRFWFYMWIVFFLFFQMLTENILERQLTVIIFSLMTSIILFLPIQEKK